MTSDNEIFIEDVSAL